MDPGGKREVVMGAFQPVLEGALVGRIRAAKADDPGAPVVVLVGSNRLAVYLRRQLAEHLPLWNVRFFTFSQLARSLGSAPLRAQGRKPLPPLAGALIIRDLVTSGAGYFRPVADLPGFGRTALASIQDLKEAGVGPDALARGKDPKRAAFRRIFERYEKTLAKLGRYDEADLMRAAAEATSSAVAGADFVAYGFYDLTGLQRRLLLAVAEQARSAAVMVPATDAPAYAYAAPLVAWLEEQGFAASGDRPAGHPLAERLFGAPEGKPARAPEVRILAAPGEPREAREIVRQVLELAARGIPFHDIGILLRNPDVYAPLLRDAFELRGIPCFVSGGIRSRETREARCLEMFADLLAGDLSRADVMQFVHFAPLALDELIDGRPDTSDWDLLSIEAGIVGGPGEWTRRLDRLAEQLRNDGESGRADAALDLKSFVAKVIEARKAVPASGAWSDLLGPLLDAYERFTTSTEERDRLCAGVRQLLELDTLDIRATFPMVRQAMADWLARRRQSRPGFQRGPVYIGDLFESRGLSFRAVLLPGLVEKSFPAAGRQDPILLDRERRALSGAAGPDVYLPMKSARPEEERMLFALSVAAATEHLTLTFPRLDVAAARERVPSHFLVRLAEARDGRRYDYKSLEQAPGFSRLPLFPAAAPERQSLDLDDYDLQHVAALIQSGRPKEILYLAGVSEPFRRGIEAETARWQTPRFTPFDGMISPDRRTAVAGEPMSPTRIESYATCPFAYFIERVLGIEELEEPEAIERITPLDRGSLFHRIFYRAYRQHAAAGEPLSADALAAALRRAAEVEFRRCGATGPALTWAVERADILADLARFAELDAAQCAVLGARPAMFETRYGMPPRGVDEDEASTEQPLELTFGGRPYRFKGKIDRIDEVGEDRVRVLDYKTGRAGGAADSFQGGRALQLPLYLLAAQMLRPERTAVTAEYVFATGRGGFRSVGFRREELDARMDDLERILVTAEACIERGVFIAAPGGGCTFCRYQDACGVNRDILFERKKADPAVADLLAMREIE